MQYDVGEGFRCRLKITRFSNLKCHTNNNGQQLAYQLQVNTNHAC